MKKTPSPEALPQEADDLLPEYDFDYRKAKPNRFAATPARHVILDEDVAKVFTTPESVNRALRALIDAFPPSMWEKSAK